MKKRVQLYAMSWCPHCHAVRDFLKGKRIPFTEFIVDKMDEDRRNKTLKKLTQLGVDTQYFPITKIRRANGKPTYIVGSRLEEIGTQINEKES